jgi:hypothetical protein
MKTVNISNSNSVYVLSKTRSLKIRNNYLQTWYKDNQFKNDC